jgi:hypothetical protein
MFGTMVISLPSPHRGGSVIVQHRDQTTTIASHDGQQKHFAWYSDVQHEMLPVEIGYRLALTCECSLSDCLDSRLGING